MHTYIIIDDEPIAREGTIAKLESLSHLLVCAGQADNGEQAIQLMQQTDPEIIITDMNMPVLDGVALLTHLSSCYPDKPIIVISGYKDFDYARQAIAANAVSYLLKPFSREELTATVLRAIHLLETNQTLHRQSAIQEEEKELARYEYDLQLLKNIVLGYQKDHTLITSRRLRLLNQYHNLSFITFCCSQSLDSQILADYLQKSEFSDLVLFLPHPQIDHLGFLILLTPQETRLSSRALCLQVSQSLQIFLETQGNTALFGISCEHFDLTDLNTARQQTITALNSLKLNGTEPFSIYSSTMESSQSSYSLFWEKEKEFLFRFENGKINEVRQLLEEFFQMICEMNQTIMELKYYCYQMTLKAYSIMEHYYNPFGKRQSLSEKNIWENLFFTEDIKNYYIQLYTNLSSFLEHHNDYLSNDIIENVKTYLKFHYRNDITLDLLSTLFYVNPTYLSHLFRKKTGEKLIDYLNQVRVEKAKELLLDPSKKMYQIARAVGYDNVKYFFRVFRKWTGQTPNQYRASHNGE